MSNYLLGENGVMVDTIHNENTDGGTLFIQFYDKHTFKLTAELHEFALYGILCQQGNSSLFCVLKYYSGLG